MVWGSSNARIGVSSVGKGGDPRAVREPRRAILPPPPVPPRRRVVGSTFSPAPFTVSNTAQLLNFRKALVPAPMPFGYSARRRRRRLRRTCRGQEEAAQCGADDPSVWRDGRRRRDGLGLVRRQVRGIVCRQRRGPSRGAGAAPGHPAASARPATPTGRRLHILARALHGFQHCSASEFPEGIGVSPGSMALRAP